MIRPNPMKQDKNSNVNKSVYIVGTGPRDSDIEQNARLM